jgi:hypothetical protein
VTWLCGGDYGTQFLGWHFYRNEPLWQLPFGLVRSYGEQRGSSLVYTDSIPLFAFIFRPFSPALPHYFQYIGLWLLTCFCLQGFFSWKLAQGLTTSLPLKVLICCFFLFAPPFLFRVNNGHSVCAQWMILAGIYCF